MSMPIHILEAREEGFQSGWRPMTGSDAISSEAIERPPKPWQLRE
jgi:hypothetical protein